MSGCLVGRLADDGHIQAPADHASDVTERHTLIGDAVIAGAGRTLLKHEPVEAGSIQTMYRGPAVEPVSDIGGNAFLTRDANQSRDEAVIALTMHGRWKADDREADPARGDRKGRLFRLSGEGRAERILFSGEGTLTLNNQRAG